MVLLDKIGFLRGSVLVSFPDPPPKTMVWAWD